MNDLLPAYRLDAPLPGARLAALARSLGISGHLTRAAASGAWLVVANATGLPGPHAPPLHSLAVFTVTGVVIYHDLRDQMYDPRRHAPSRAQAVAVARAWLPRLGWPGQRMPVQGARYTGGGWLIDLGWPGVDAATPAASLEVGSGGHVDEARLWPPLARSSLVPARDARGALAEVQAGQIPFAVTETDLSALFLPTGGRGTVQSVTVVQVVVTGSRGWTYLVPAYRFAGTAHLTGGGPSTAGTNATWYALVSAVQR